MAYYMTGDYYVGDPGIFGKLFGTIGRVVGGFVRGGPMGAAGALLPRAPGIAQFPGPTPGGGMRIPVGGGIGIHPTKFLPGGKPFITQAGGACPPGMHLDKRTRSRCVSNRSMNPTNPRALRRAVRRQQGFVAVARRVLRGTGLSIKRSGMGTKRGAVRRRR